MQVRDLIGTPPALDQFSAPTGKGDEQLPPASEALLLHTVTLFALVTEIFDGREQALEWWRTPLKLRAEGAAKAPRDWVAEPGAVREIASRIRRTLNGIM